MTKKRSFKNLAIVLCLALVVSLIPGMAFGETGEFPVKMVQNNIKEVNYLTRIGLNDVTSVKTSKDGKALYKVESFDAIDDTYVTVTEIEEGVIYDIYEGDKHDALTIYADGRIKIDDNFVTIGENAEFLRLGSSISPRARYNNFSDKPFKGKASDYNTYVGTTKDGYIELGKIIANLTSVALGVTIAGVLGLSNFGQMVTGFCVNLASGVISEAKAKAPSSKTMSKIVERWEYVNAGTALDHYYKYVPKIYAQGSYKGTGTQGVYYEYNYFA